MSINKICFLGLIMLISACSNDLFIVHNGNIPTEDKIAEIHLGQTKDDVTNILGAPSVITGLSDDHWIYMSSTVKKVAFLKPEELNRQILALTFENGTITKIEKRNLEDGYNIAVDTDETKSANRELGFFRKYFGGVGSYTPFSGNTNKGI